MSLALTDETIKLIRDDADLYAKVSKELKKAPTYLAILLQKKDSRLTQLNVLQIIADHTGIIVDKLVEKENAEVTDSITTAN